MIKQNNITWAIHRGLREVRSIILPCPNTHPHAPDQVKRMRGRGPAARLSKTPACINLAILEASCGSSVLGLLKTLAFQTYVPTVLKLLPTGLSPVIALGKLTLVTLPGEPMASE